MNPSELSSYLPARADERTQACVGGAAWVLGGGLAGGGDGAFFYGLWTLSGQGILEEL